MWEPYKKGFKAWLQLEKSLAENSVEAYLRDIDKLTEYLLATKKLITPQELKLKDLEKKGNVEKIAFALVHTGLGNKDAAFEWLEKVYADGSYQRLLYLNGGNWVDPLRADQRFAVFVKKLGLTK